MVNKTIEFNSIIPMTYRHENISQNKPLLIVLHGYTDSNAAALRRLYPDNLADLEILAPNGLFPVPAKRGEVWKPAYAWYFADFSKNAVLMHPDISAKAVAELLMRLDLVERPKILLGFSQGVFFMPYLLRQIQNVQAIFAVGAAYRSEDYGAPIYIPFEALHGSDDEVIPLEAATSSFNKFVTTKCKSGTFKIFSGLKHTMNEESRIYLRDRIVEAAARIHRSSR